MNRNRQVIAGLLLILVSGVGLPRLAAAGHGFELRPAKIEAALGAGEETELALLVTNHTAAAARLSVSLEDFGPYSLLPYLTLMRRSADLAPGESVSLPFLISLPAGLPAPGFYGAIIVSFDPNYSSGAPAPLSAVSRLGALVFVRVAAAPAEESGALTGFGLLGRRLIRRGEPVIFHINYENRGNIYLNPYGLLTVASRFGGAKFSQEIDPWFVLPASARLREITLPAPLPAGLYRAHLALNRGYGDVVDEASATFIVWSWFTVGLDVLIVLIIFMFVWLIRGKIFKYHG
ncbi:MAG: hypothetical protein HYT46_00870 [Candidatus Vogelbacteria bacterium]|nr:hypothetical protein [Candidatus Vogelbacteria bacterium]